MGGGLYSLFYFSDEPSVAGNDLHSVCVECEVSGFPIRGSLRASVRDLYFSGRVHQYGDSGELAVLVQSESSGRDY